MHIFAAGMKRKVYIRKTIVVDIPTGKPSYMLTEQEKSKLLESVWEELRTGGTDTDNRLSPADLILTGHNFV